MGPVRSQPLETAGRVREFVVPAVVSEQDVSYAVRAVVVHGPEEWPSGLLCRSCRPVAFPCRLHRWGRRVLTVWGLSEGEIEALVVASDPDVTVPRPVVGQ